MLQIRDMARGEMAALLSRAEYGHLAVASDGHPYVVPMHYAFDGEDIYFFTTEGTKTECLDHIETTWTDMRPLSVRATG